MSDKIANKSWF